MGPVKWIPQFAKMSGIAQFRYKGDLLGLPQSPHSAPVAAGTVKTAMDRAEPMGSSSR